MSGQESRGSVGEYQADEQASFELEDGAVSVKILALTGDFVPLCTPQESGV